MPDEIPDLWPDDINVKVLSPFAILKMQQHALAQRTQGMLEGRLSRVETEALVSYLLDLTAPSLEGGYTERILAATHAKGRYYPVKVQAACFAPKSQLIATLAATPLLGEDLSPSERKAATAEEFINLVREVLRSADVRSLIQSLIASINEEDAGRATAG